MAHRYELFRATELSFMSIRSPTKKTFAICYGLKTVVQSTTSNKKNKQRIVNIVGDGDALN